MPTNRILNLLSIFLIIVILLIPQSLINNGQLLHLTHYYRSNSYQADPTPTLLTATQTPGQPSSRLGGGNTILICGAGILVMIIIGAVLLVPRPPNHSGE